MKKIKLNPEDELHLIVMVRDDKPCEWTTYGRKLNIVCDTHCPLRRMVAAGFYEYLRDVEAEKYEREYPDG